MLFVYVWYETLITPQRAIEMQPTATAMQDNDDKNFYLSIWCVCLASCVWHVCAPIDR